MAGSVNKVILVGNVGNQPEIRSTQDGRRIANFSIATTDSWNDKATGEKREKTEWHRVVIFNDKLVGVVENYVPKGTKLYIEGSLQTRKWVDNGGIERYTTEIVIQGFGGQFTILSSKGSVASDASSGMGGMDSSATTPGFMPSMAAAEDDDIPF